MPPSPQDSARAAALCRRIPSRSTHLHSCQRQLLVGRSPRCDSPTTGPAGAALARSSARPRPEARSTVPSARSATAARGSRPAPSPRPAPQLGPAPCRAPGGSHPGKCRRRAPSARLRATAVGREDYKSQQAVRCAQAQAGGSSGALPHLLLELCRAVNTI